MSATDSGATGSPGPVAPHDLDAEEHVLGACLIAARAVDDAARVVRPEHFYRDNHARIYEAILDLRAGGADPDTVLVAAELEARGILDETLRARLVELARIVPAASNVERWARIVRDRARDRAILYAARDLAAAATNGGVDRSPDVRARLLELLNAPVDHDRHNVDLVDLALLLASDPPIIPWQWEGWIALGDLVMVAGDPGTKKSLAMLELLVAIVQGRDSFLGAPLTRHRGGRVLMVDLENPTGEMHKRLYEFGLRFDDDELELLRYAHMPDLSLADPDGLARLEALLVDQAVELVVLDSFRRIAPGIDENDSAAVSAILTPLRTMSARLNVTIVVIHHAKKKQGGESLDAGSMIRGSGDILASLDQMLFHRNRPGESDAFTIEHGKARRGQPHPSILVRIVETEHRDGEHGIRLELEGDVANADDKVERMLEKIARILEEDGGPVRRSSLAMRAGVSGDDSTFKRALKLGHDRGRLAKTLEQDRPGAAKRAVYALAYDGDPHAEPDYDPDDLTLDV